MTKEFQHKILEALKEKDISPRPRWTFLVKEKMIWASAGVVIVLGSLAAATTIAIVSMHDLDIAGRLEHTKAGWLLLSLPYAWIVLLVGFLLLAEYNIRHTKQGYRYSLIKITGGVIGLSIIGGLGLYSIGLGHDLDDVMSRHVPAYEKFGNRRAAHLLNPERGVLAGKVLVQEEEFWQIQDVEKHIWVVSVEDAEIVGREHTLVGKPVRVIGELIKDDEAYAFEAGEILPMKPPHGFDRTERKPLRERRPPPQQTRTQ
ncbi:MAG: hypothetical protein COU33_03835 [Candidatus Magasanikbacteria bacterium CG10_big_fil_rev_8_21_14_0_10_43_6]|uniref:Uncharacterized protein n=1 Tax=Candidatus Magasanikbacteria bacterium CG10_big_fil_rev_8_21_14_0_10_43_6 TaxID=1974650 RepID=A0A2M6W0M6_9BACT|nr:MAG: hypothetical protein COU33_03835 [Candidatus Magasanikbacteria bacterium CG10_big_fil_rev_8_21_14_0_10_43_6]